jgi:hypothetical protein
MAASSTLDVSRFNVSAVAVVVDMPTTLQPACRSRSLRFLARFDHRGREMLQKTNSKWSLHDAESAMSLAE